MSNNIALLTEERIVTSSDNDVLVLTTKRVRYDSVTWGRSNLISITLGSVASCGLVTRSFPFLLILAAIAVVAAFMLPLLGLGLPGQALGILSVVVVGLIVAYFLTRKAVISVASNGGQTIMVPTKGMDREAIIGFIEAVEREKLK